MAVGSPLGQSILKAVLGSSLPSTIHVADISKNAAGLYMGNVVPVIFPLIKAPEYFKTLTEYIDKHAINMIFPTIAEEHIFFAEHEEYFKQRQIHIATCAPETFEICNDKFQSMIFLRKHGIDAPETILCSNKVDVENFLSRTAFPVVLKPRFGASSNDVFIVKGAEEYRGITSAYPDDYFILQEFLSDQADYTVGTFVSQDSSFKETFIIDRKLKFGLSYSGQVIENEDITQHCIQVANVLQSVFSINLQLKLEKGKPFTYEINPRLSSTTSIRAHFGFNEPDMIMRDFFNIKPLAPNVKARSGHFSRFWEEYYQDSK